MNGQGRNFSGRKQTPFVVALIALTLLWISFPPVGIWWLAWLAPIPLIWLVIVPVINGSHPYRQIWFASLIYWLATFYFIPYPHPVLWLGLIAVSLYMSIYTPMFVAVSRVLVHRYRVPVVWAAPIVWTGIEWIRCNFATGMAMVCLSHTQFKHPLLIQVADLSGAYTLTFAIVMFAAGVTAAIGTISLSHNLGSRTDLQSAGGSGIGPKTMDSTPMDDIPSNSRKATIGSRIMAGLFATVAVGSVIIYGWIRMNEIVSTQPNKIQIALVQSSIDVVLELPTLEERTRQLEQYRDLTLAARSQWPDLDLIVWPESSFPIADLISDLDEEHVVQDYALAIAGIWESVTGYPNLHQKPVPLLACAGTHDPAKGEVFNSAILVRDPGVITDRYFKNHRVMFGEYIPFADWIPILQNTTSIGAGLTAGTKFETFRVGDINIAPSICFETTIPHLIRRQVNSLASDGREPDVLMNLTNDGWFFGASCLDLHLACNVFRAVEMRKPHLVCANTGFSAEINSSGRLLQIGKRRDVDLLKADVTAEQRSSPYRWIGDLIPSMFGWLCVFVLIISLFGSSAVRQPPA